MKKIFLSSLFSLALLAPLAASVVFSSTASAADTQQDLYDYCSSSGIEYAGGCDQYAADLASQGAQAPAAYQGGLAQGLVKCDEQDPTSCSLCSLFLTIKAVYDFVIQTTILLAVAFIMYGGYQMLISGANPSQYAKGRSHIYQAFLGLGITLSAWLLVDMFIRALTGSGDIYGVPWRTLQCQ